MFTLLAVHRIVIHCVQLYCCTGQNLFKSHLPNDDNAVHHSYPATLAIFPCESQTCPVGCEYAVGTIGVLEVISRLKEPWHYRLPLPMGLRPRVFHLLANDCFFINFAITYPRIVVVPDCRDAAVKGPLRLLMLYRQFA